MADCSQGTGSDYSAIVLRESTEFKGVVESEKQYTVVYIRNLEIIKALLTRTHIYTVNKLSFSDLNPDE